MVYSSAGRRSNFLPALALLTALALVCAQQAAASTLRWMPQRQTENTEPVSVFAGRVSTWTENGQRYFFLQDDVWICHGIVTIRFQEGVIRVKEETKSRKRGRRLRIYAEGEIFVEEGAKNLTSQTAHLELTTGGEVKVKASEGGVRRQSRANSPLFRRALKEFTVSLSAVPPAPKSGSTATPRKGSPGRVVVPNDSEKNVELHPRQAIPKLFPSPLSQLGTKSIRDAARAAESDTVIQLVGAPPTPPPGKSPPGAPSPPSSENTSPFPDVFGDGPGPREWVIRPRSFSQGIHARNFLLPTGETAVVVSSGIILTVFNADGKGGILDIEADQLVFWTQGNTQQILQDLQSSRSQKHRSLEFYMSGNVEIRVKTALETRLLRASEVYYDVNRHVAIATNANLEINDPRLLNPIHMEAHQLLQLNENLFQAANARVNASALPWDPGLSIFVREATLETKPIVRKSIFGFPIINRETGLPVTDTQRYFKGRNIFLELEEIPIFYLPYLQGDAEDPLGPLQNVSMGYNRIFGFQIYTTWDVYDLIGTTAIPGTRWRLNIDGLTDRGPALGSDFTFQGENLLGIPNRYTGVLKGYGIYDTGEDIIGGDRGRMVLLPFGAGSVPVTHPDWRGRFYGRTNVQDLPMGFMVQSKISAISDMNFLEQYYWNEFQTGLNQETYLYVKQQQGNWAWTGLIEPRIRRWITETEWLPRFDGYILGASLFDVATYNLKASGGYAELEPTDQVPLPFLATDADTNTARLDLWQEISIPFGLGPVNLAPYGIVDLTYYSNDLTGDDRGRFYGAGGVRGSMPLSRLYVDSCSELFNVNGIFHKVVFTTNYYTAYSDTPFSRLPQLDRLNDDASDQALRFLFASQPLINPEHGLDLITNPLFNPQTFALRNLVLSRIDTRDDLEVVQLGINQRWQTKRGFPGKQHIIDWMTLNLSGSLFPRRDRDNFGETAAFLKYDWIWNIGDRTSLVSNGWFDPFNDGPRVFDLGAVLNRPNGTSFYLGYRQIDPLESRAVIGSLAYNFSRKYSMTASATYDFGVENQITSLVLTRRGKDLRVSLGVTYNSILDTAGFIFEIMPNIMPSSVRSPAVAGPYTSTTANN